MLTDEDLLRSPAPRPYCPGSAQLSISINALTATLSSLRRAGRLESSVFWYGPRDGDQAVVAAVLTPQQIMTRGNYDVSAAAMSEMVALLEEDWKPLAQIHSHPGRSVEHSRYDDRMASSRRALSIVFPYYGDWSSCWPQGAGVHEWQNNYWHLLNPLIAEKRVLLLRGGTALVRDLRR
jgi:hypothetical protein